MKFLKFLLHFVILTAFALVAIPLSPLLWLGILIQDALKQREQRGKKDESSISPFAFFFLVLGVVVFSPFRVIFGYFNVFWGWRSNDKLRDCCLQIIMWGID